MERIAVDQAAFDVVAANACAEEYDEVVEQRKFDFPPWQRGTRIQAAGRLFGALLNGVADGTRTRDNWNHNPGLYQLSYSHR